MEKYKEKVLACWLGKVVGGTLGMPYEGCDGPLDLEYYDPVPTDMLPNDDLDLQVLWACLLADQNYPEVSRTLFAKGWREHIAFPWDEYGVCIRNLNEGIEPPYSGSFDNWFSHGMGAAIRSELWACLAPGNPSLAVQYAWEDACLDHAEEGIHAELWLAAMQSAAFVEEDLRNIVKIGFEYIPVNSEIRRAVEDTEQWWRESGDWRRVRECILRTYGHENFTHVTANMAFVMLALLAGEGDFGRSICTAANCGKDTDCNAATVGALLGIMNPDGIEEQWLRPIGNTLRISPEITGIHPPATLEAFTDLLVDLKHRLDGRSPPKPGSVTTPPGNSVAVGIGFGQVPWFGQGWPFGIPLILDRPEMQTVYFSGTIGTHACGPGRNALFVEYAFHLKQETRVRVFFNTREPCRVFLNDHFVFGHDGHGRMAPSPHRIPINHAVDRTLTAGNHLLTAVIDGSNAPPQKLEWVAGVADQDNNLQWVPFAFRTRTQNSRTLPRLMSVGGN